METRTQRWGNSLGVRIPKAFADELGLQPDSVVELTLEDGSLRLRPLTGPRYALADLLAAITDDNRHDETAWGADSGREAQW